eukprot:6995268-Prorocentrum_lima.AAC.1
MSGFPRSFPLQLRRRRGGSPPELRNCGRAAAADRSFVASAMPRHGRCRVHAPEAPQRAARLAPPLSACGGGWRSEKERSQHMKPQR